MTYSITTKDGITINNIPDTVDPNSDELKARVARIRAQQEMPTPQVEAEQTSAMPTGRDVARQLGLTARAGITGAAGLPLLAGDALNTLINLISGGVSKVTGAEIPQLQMPSQVTQRAITQVGLPQPETKSEKVAQDVASAVAGVGAPAALIQRGLQAGRAAVAQPSALERFFVEGLPLQTAGAVGGAGASAAGREYADVGAGGQLGLAMLGGMVAPSATTTAIPAAGRLARETVRPFTEAGREVIAGNVLRQLSRDADTAVTRMQEFQPAVPGYTPTTAQASRDVGLISAETPIRALDVSGKFAMQASEANKARMAILDRLAKDQDTLNNAITKRDEVTDPIRIAAFANPQLTPEQMQRGVTLVVDQQIKDVLKSPAGKRDSVISVMNDVKADISRATNVDELYEIRKDLRAAERGLLDRSQRGGASAGAYKVANKELNTVIKAVDDVIESAAPGYRDYLNTYAQASRGIEKLEAAQGFRSKVLSTIPDPINVGQFMISQPNFTRAIRAAAKETDLSPMQVKVLERVGRDLDSGVLNRSGRVPGSDTFKNLSTANVIGGIIGKQMFGEVPAAANKVVAPLNWLYNGTDDQIRELLVDAMLDPKLAAKLMTKATTTNIEPISKELQRKALNLGYGAAFGITE
jgi:hypothetical protein